jgi:hypothetical protein
LPPPDLLGRRLKALNEMETYFFRRVCVDGEDSAAFAKRLGMSEAKVMGYVNEAIRKLTRES